MFIIVADLYILRAQEDTLEYNTNTIEVEAERIDQSKLSNYLDIHRLEVSEIDKLNMPFVTDKIKYFPNIFIKDYGGMGGIKTISMRGTASSQTTILIDGISISSSQNSIVDFSMLPLAFFDNIDIISNGSSSLFGSNSIGGSINLHSQIPKKKSTNISASFGSFGYANFSLTTNSTVFKFPYFINFNYMSSKNDYPFDYNYFGERRIEKRHNSDINSISGSIGMELPLNKSLLSTKMFIINSDRGSPGAVILGKIENSLARLNESKLMSLSNLYTKIDSNITNELKFLFSYSASDYSDKEFLPNDNLANSYFISRDFRFINDFTINYDKISQIGTINFQFSNLTGNKLSLDVDNYVQRFNLGIGYNISYDFIKNNKFTISTLLSMKYDYWDDIKSIFSYSIGLGGKNIIKNTDVKLMYSNNYRIPNFNEMYYLNYGTIDLKPEQSYSYSFSVDIFANKFFKINFNSYFIETKDQIVSTPKSTISWSAQNIAKVHNYGASFNAQLSLFNNSLFSMFSYTYQQSIDKTLNSPSYNKLLPYLPQEIISLMIDYKYNILSIGTNIYYNSFRYYSFDNYIKSLLEPYYYIDVNLSIMIKILSNNLSFSLILNNITNQSYQIINNYPMPKRNFRLSLSYKF